MGLHQLVEKRLAFGVRGIERHHAAHQASYQFGKNGGECLDIGARLGLHAPDQVGREAKARTDTVIAGERIDLRIDDRPDPQTTEKLANEAGCRRREPGAEIGTGRLVGGRARFLRSQRRCIGEHRGLARQILAVDQSVEFFKRRLENRDS